MKGTFPKHLFFRFVTGQLILALPALALTAVLIRQYLLRNPAITPEHQAILTGALFSAAGFMAVILILISLWMGYRLVFPLGRVLMKARAIQSREYSKREELEAVEKEEGEWSDLESTLNRIEANMQTQDVSLVKERGELEGILTAINDAVIAVDNRGESLFFNSPFAVLFGPKGEIGATLRVTDFVRSPEVVKAFEAALQRGQRSKFSALIPLRHDRLERHFSVSVAPFGDAKGNIFGAVGVFHDVDELKRMEQIRIDFVANVSHELRTPLTAIKGYSETLQGEIKGKGMPIAEKASITIERNVNRLIELVEDLLNLSSLESGTKIQKEKINLRELTDRVVSQLESRRADKGQKLAANLETTTLVADPRRVEQVLYNLLDNAIKYVPSGKKIEIFWENLGTSTVLRVVDNGLGIPFEHHARLFERFYRVDTARTRELGGTGLGLSIVKHIMQRHGGSIEVKSVATGGTEFICTFPPQEEIR